MKRLLGSTVTACIVAVTATAEEREVGNWRVAISVDRIDDSTTVIASISSGNTFVAVGCDDELYFVVANRNFSFFDRNSKITTRVGTNTPSSLYWEVLGDDEWAFRPRPVALIDEILSTESTDLAVSYWTSDDQMITDLLDTSGADKAFEIVTDACPIH